MCHGDRKGDVAYLGVCRTDLATGGLGEPQSPFVLERVLDIKVVLVVEDGDKLVVGVGGIEAGLALGGDGDGGEVNLFRHGECTVGEAMKKLDRMGEDSRMRLGRRRMACRGQEGIEVVCVDGAKSVAM